MSVWEYKVISSGKGGFATPALLETFLNQLGKDEWEIIHYQSPGENALAFSGLARRSTQRDWTLEDAVAAAARVEAEKLRAEFEAKFKGAGAGSAAPAEEKPLSIAAEKAESDDGLRRLRNTEGDLEAGSDDEEEGEPDEWQKLAVEEDLPTFFEAIQPLMRRNQRGAGMSVGVDQLAKKWHMSEQDIVAALKECGFAIPEDEDDKPEYIDYDGDLFWVNVNRRGELWVNTKEKPRPVFRSVAGTRFSPEPSAATSQGSGSAESGKGPGDGYIQTEAAAHGSAEEGQSPPAAEGRMGDEGRVAEGHPGGENRKGVENRERNGRGHERESRGREPRQSEGNAGGRGKGLPEGPALLERIRPHMRRNRGSAGGSGSVGFLARALKCRESDLEQRFMALGLTLGGEGGVPSEIAIADSVWSLNRDHRGGVWINERRAQDAAPAVSAAVSTAENQGGGPPASGEAASGGDAAHAEAPSTSGTGERVGDEPSGPRAETGGSDEPPAEKHPLSPDGASFFSAVRPLLKETRAGASGAEIGHLAETLGQDRENLTERLTGIGLRVPEKAREKPYQIEHAGEVYWLSRNGKGEIWLNAKGVGAGGGRSAAAPSGGRIRPRPARLPGPSGQS